MKHNIELDGKKYVLDAERAIALGVLATQTYRYSDVKQGDVFTIGEVKDLKKERS